MSKMKLSVVLLAVLACSSYCQGAAIKDDVNQNRGPTLTELNTITKHLKTLDLAGLLNFAREHNSISYIVSVVFRQQFANYEIKIEIPETRSKSAFDRVVDWLNETPEELEYVGPPMRVIGNTIEIIDYETALDILKYFGGDLKSLKIKTYATHTKRVQVIGEHIRKYCTNLVKLSVGKIHDSTLQLFKGAFVSVNEFSCVIVSGNVANKLPALKQLFPNLHRLSMTIQTAANVQLKDYQLPHLEHLSMPSLPIMRWNAELQAEHLFKANPHIRSIDLPEFSQNFVKIINRDLKLVENMTLAGLDTEDEEIQFDHVKVLELKHDPIGSPAKITFHNLEEIRFKYEHEMHAEWLTFFQKHSNLKRINMRVFGDESVFDTKFNEITTVLDDLEEMIFESSADVSAAGLAEFIENHKHLKILKFHGKFYKHDDKAFFDEKFGNEWIIHESKCLDNTWNGVTFEKKQ